MTPNNTMQDFWSRVTKIPGGCWAWTGQTDKKGYGRFWLNGQMHQAHRLSMGDVPDDMTVDHLCRNKGCVNPEHLEIVTRAENTRRYWLSRTHCKHGHEFSKDNTRLDKLGKRVCRACKRAAWYRTRQKQRQESA